MTRFPPIAPQDRTPEQADMAARAIPGGPFDAYQRSPALWEQLQPLRMLIADRFPDRTREVAILAVAAQWRSATAIASHRRLALKAGLDAEMVGAILAGSDVALEGDDVIVLETTRALLREGRVGDALFARATAAIGEAGVVELTALVGFYTGLSLVLNLAEADA